MSPRLRAHVAGLTRFTNVALLLVAVYFFGEYWIFGSPDAIRELPIAVVLLVIGASSVYRRHDVRAANDEALVARASLAAYARGQAGIRALSQDALGGVPSDQLLPAAARLVAEQLCSSHAAFFELRPESCDLVLRAGFGWEPGLVGTATIGTGSGSHSNYALGGFGAARTALGDEALFAHPPLLRGERIVAGLTVIVGPHSAPFGILAAYSTEPREYSDEDAQFLQLLADLMTSMFRRRKAEADLARSEERLRLALELTMMGTFDDDLVARTTTWSKSLCEMMGLDPEAKPGYETFTSLLHPDDRRPVGELIAQAIATGGDYEIEDCRVCRPDGQIRRFFARGTVIRDRSGRPVRLVGVALDVTERRRGQQQQLELEAQLRQAQKMEAVGQLAGGIAHDFNNLLLALRGYGELALRALERGEDARDDVKQMLASADRAGALTRQLLAFSRRQVLQPQVVDLNSVVLELQNLLTRLIGEDVEVEVEQAVEPVCVHADRGQLEQVITNLALNARDAMPDGGKLTMRISSTDVPPDHQLPLEPGRYALIAVSDTGCGMDPVTAAQIFEPFFTTKDGIGTGLGLSTVHGIVKQSGGHIWVYSEPGAGTTFQIYLPLIEDAQRPEEPMDAVAPEGRGETVLLVEDDGEVRSFVGRMLSESGYRVITASSGDEALELVVDEPIDLLLTDVVMRGLSGRQTAERIRELHPETAVLYMSGYTDDAVLRRGLLGPDTAFLQKPFGSVDLARKVRQLLDA